MRARNKSRRKTTTFRATAVAASLSTALVAGLWHAPVHADAIDDLFDRLKAKGILTEDEHKELKDIREGEKAVARSRRKEENERATKAEDRAKTEMVGSFSDGIRWESADKKNSFSINGRVQLDYRDFGGDDALVADTFDIRRAYLTAAGRFWEFYTFDVTADFGALANNSHLDVAWLNVGWWKPANIRFGQFKMPMSIDELTSSRFIDFQERSILDQFVAAKERGVMVHGEPTTGVFYGVALSTGQGKNTNEINNSVDSTDVIGRVGVNIAELIGQKNAVYHIAASFSDGTIPTGNTLSARTEGRGITFFNTSAFTGADVDRERRAFEASVAWGPVKLQSEYLQVNFSGTSAAIAASVTPAVVGKPAQSFDRDIDIWYASVNWLITGEQYADSYRTGTYGRIRPKNNFSPKGGGWGAWELGLRYTDFDAGDFPFLEPNNVDLNNGAGVLSTTSSASTTRVTNKATAWTLGLKWIPTPNTRFLLNYIETKFDTPVTVSGTTTEDEKAITFRAQFDF